VEKRKVQEGDGLVESQVQLRGGGESKIKCFDGTSEETDRAISRGKGKPKSRCRAHDAKQKKGDAQRPGPPTKGGGAVQLTRYKIA